jgi:hypothetical protein
MDSEPSGTSGSRGSTARSAADSGLHRRYAVAGLWCLAIGVGFAVATGLISGDIRDRRLHTCDGTIVLPTWGLAVAWAGVIVGLVAVVLCVAAFVKRPSAGVIGALCALSIFALLFDLLFLNGAYHYVAPTHHLCSG